MRPGSSSRGNVSSPNDPFIYREMQYAKRAAQVLERSQEGEERVSDIESRGELYGLLVLLKVLFMDL